MAEGAEVAPNMPSFLSNLLETGIYSDFTLESHGKKFCVHKAIVCSQSSVIAAALNGNFKESKTGHLKVDDSFSLETVQYMLDLLYTGKYQVADVSERPVQTSTPTTSAKVDATPAATSSTTSPNIRPVQPSTSAMSTTKRPPGDPKLKPHFLSHYHAYVIADYYAIQNLKSQALKDLKLLLSESWDVKVFLDTTCEILKGISEGLIVDLLASAMASHMDSLLKSAKFGVMEEHGAFVVKVLKSYHAMYRKPICQAEGLLARVNKCHD